MVKKFLILTLFYGLLASLKAEDEFAPIVEVSGGKVRGLVTHFNHEELYFYEGIRFGTAKRFSPPEPVQPWSDIYNATRYRFACPQVDHPPASTLPLDPKIVASNEDCLFLNVWQPKPDPNANIKNPAYRPVLVWIYGGGFVIGHIFMDFYDGRALAEAGDAVVVSVNYRVGALGFFGTDSDETPGNLGLRDQILALQWVKENIHAFGGDPNRVTIFGQSAGSISVGALILSPLASGLFNKAILQSGAPNSYIGSESKVKQLEKAKLFAEKYKCPTDSQPEMVKCLRGKTLEEIISQDKNGIFNGESFIPVYGDKVLPLSPVQALKTGKFNQGIDLIFGVNNGEGSGFVNPFLGDLNANISLDKTKFVLDFMFQLFKEPFHGEVADYYMKGLVEEDYDGKKKAIAAAFGDYQLTCPTILFAEEYAKHSPASHTYSYRLTHQGAHLCQGWEGACHGEETHYIFGKPMKNLTNYSAEDYQISLDMIRAWTQFAKSGEIGEVGQGHKWEEAFKAGVGPLKHLNLNPIDYRMVQGFYEEVCDKFWKPKIFNT